MAKFQVGDTVTNYNYPYQVGATITAIHSDNRPRLYILNGDNRFVASESFLEQRGTK